MKKLIDQFMWAFQHIFRTSVEYEIEKTLSTIGLHTHGKAKVLLIGIAKKDDLRHKICIEPEGGPLIVDDLRSLQEKTEEIQTANPESQVFYSHPIAQERRTRELFLRSRAHAIAEVIQDSRRFEELSFFVSNSAPIAGYDVHTCVGIPCDALESVPCFTNPQKDDYHGRHIEESFVQVIISACLSRADRALYLPYPGQGIMILGDRTEIVREAAIRFVEGVTFALTLQPTDLFNFANEISSLTYERSSARGFWVVTDRDNLTNKMKTEFLNPVRLREARTARKLLELTDATTSLLTDGQAIYGLGDCISAPDVVKIAIDGHARWSLSTDDRILMKVAYGHATLPKQILDKSLFKDVADRTVGTAEVERIWDIFQCALDGGQGTTIVVSKDPVSELQRLSQEALSVKPEYLDHKDVARLGRVDGAILLGPDGRCYAFGVILDGLATSSGNRARGARFNSSVRYQRTAKPGTMIIVISDDGTVDLVPNLMPRVSRQEVEEAVQAFCEYSGSEANDGEEWARQNRQVEQLKFYLNEDQCSRVNEAYEKEMDSRLASDGIKMHREPLQPNPDMDESYFLDD